jgi:hypothetical protein
MCCNGKCCKQRPSGSTTCSNAIDCV